MAVIKFKDAAGNWQTLPSAGPAGKSAYELAVSQGYTGTLDEWLATLHGGNDNLLINGYFRAPVNQRGITNNWTVGQYGLDRWLLVNGTCIVSSGGITLNGALAQRMETLGATWPLNGRVMTVSIMLADGTIQSGQIVPSGTGAVAAQLGDVVVGMHNEAQSWKVLTLNPNGAANIAAVKLELGTVSTLAQDPPVDYGAELLRCLRYALAYDTIERVRACVCSANYIDFHVATPVPLRIVPSIEQNTMKIIPLNGGTAVDGFAFSILGRTASYLRVRATKTAHGLTDAVLELASVGTRTVFTADL